MVDGMLDADEAELAPKRAAVVATGGVRTVARGTGSKATFRTPRVSDADRIAHQLEQEPGRGAGTASGPREMDG